MMKRVTVTGIIWCLLLTGLSGCKSRSVSVAEAEQNPVACALLVADTLGDRSDDLLADVALGFAKAGECERALRLAESFKEKEWFRSNPYLVSSKAVTLGKIFAICTRNGNQAIADQAYASASLTRNETNGHPYVGTWGVYNSFAMNLAELGNVNEAIRMVAESCKDRERMEQDSIVACRADGLAGVAEKLFAIGLNGEASKLAGMVAASADEIKDASLHVSAIVKAAQIYLLLGENEQSRNLLKMAVTDTSKSGESSDRDESRREIANAFLKAGDFKNAENVIALLKLEYKRSWAWRDFAVKAAETGDCQLALRSSEKISGFDDKADALKAVVKRYAEHNDFQKAIEICEQVKGYGNRADARLIVARKYAQTNDLVNAKKFLDLAVEDATNESSGSYHSQWSRHLQTALLMAAIGEKDRAISVIKEIGKQEVSSGSLVDAASEAANEGNYDLAIEISNFVTADQPCDHCGLVSKERYKSRILIDSLLKYAEAKRKGLDEGKNVPLAVLKNLGLKP